MSVELKDEPSSLHVVLGEDVVVGGSAPAGQVRDDIVITGARAPAGHHLREVSSRNRSRSDVLWCALPWQSICLSMTEKVSSSF